MVPNLNLLILRVARIQIIKRTKMGEDILTKALLHKILIMILSEGVKSQKCIHMFRLTKVQKEKS